MWASGAGFWRRLAANPEVVREAGQRLGDFVLLRPLGRGGMGIVWEAEQISVRRKVALKLLRADAWHSPEALRRFRREAEAAGRLRHPAIVRLYAAGDADGTPYIAQELVPDGRSLVDEMERLCAGAVSHAEQHCRVAEIFAALAEALHAAHEHGVLHRDVKPANVLIAADGQPMLCDFGVARLDEPDGGTMTGALVGTPHYMSPEILDPRWGLVGPRADVFSLGVALFECLAGRKPFDGASAHQVMRATLEDEPADLRRLAPDLPRDLVAICQKALEKAPERRYLDARAMAEDLRHWLRGEPVLARPIGAVARCWRWSKRHPAWSLAAVALLLGLGVTTLLLVQLSARQSEVARLALAEDYRRLVQEADALWPIRSEDIERLERWLLEAQALLAEEDALEQLYDRSGKRGGERVGGLDLTWWRQMLAELLADLRRLRDPVAGPLRGKSVEHGVGMEERLGLARELARHESDPALQRLWQTASAEIRDPAVCPAYAGFDLPVQAGLLPLHRDPQSGLWEFADFLTGEPPELDPVTGSWRIAPETGMVFILVPPLAFTMGAQNEDPQAANYAEHARKHELGLIPLRLEPFLLSKYELTQGQWLRQTGANPSYYPPQDSGLPPSERFHPYPVDLSHPLEHVGLRTIEAVLDRLGMDVPTGAQWEAVARSGCAGDMPPEEWLRGENLFDLAAAREAVGTVPEPWDDGYWLHAPVGSFASSGLGFHDLYGNVAEYCADPFTYSLSELAPRAGDGRSGVNHPQTAVTRGGMYSSTRYMNRLSMRRSTTSTSADSGVGVRPVRRLMR